MPGDHPAAPADAVRPLPSGTVTFLFTDIEGSTRLVESLGAAYGSVLADERRLIRAAATAHAGVEVGTEGDSHFIAFPSAIEAVCAAVDAQRALAAQSWPAGHEVRVRMGIHTGEAATRAEDYIGLDVHRAARIMSAGHGGQILLSGSTKPIVEEKLPEGLGLRDLGEHRLKDLSRPERLYQVLGVGLEDAFPAVRSLEATPNNLPSQLTTFVGRAREVEAIARLLENERLLTLTGPGGTGKTRLALQVAAEAAARFAGGAFFVPLASIADPDLVASTIASELGIREGAGRPTIDRIVEDLADRELLLVLDNFEQVVDAAPLVADLLRRAPGVRAIVTSRAVLRISGEREVAVPPLRVPRPGERISAADLPEYDGVALFVERAAAIKPDFGVTEDNAPAVAEIVARLDGLPLAIELAAARIRLLDPTAMLARLEHRLDLLGGAGRRDLPDRQRTLRGAIAWSHDLLDPAGRRLFARFSVFVDGATLDEAEAVCGPAGEIGVDVLEGLEGLAEHSLIRPVESAAEPRFAMLPTINEFAAERLAETGEANEILERHATVFLALAESAVAHLSGSEQKVWLARLGRDHDNLRAAMNRAVENGQAERALRFAAALWRFWQIRGHLEEATDRIERALAMDGAAAHAAERAAALDAAGGIAYWRGDHAVARRHYESALAAYRAVGDERGVAGQLYNASFTWVWDHSTAESEDLVRARELIAESLAIFRRLDDRSGMARALWAMMNTWLRDDESREVARRLGEEALTLFEQLGDRMHAGWAIWTLGLLDIRAADLDAAEGEMWRALELFRDADDIGAYGIVLDGLAAVAWRRGDLDRSGRLAGVVAGIERSTGLGLSEANRRIYGFDPAAARADPVFAAAFAEGEQLPVEAAVRYALGRDETIGHP